MRSLDKLQALSLLVLRMVLAVIFIYHGYPKLTHTHGNLRGVFVEPGLPGYFVYLSGILETFGGGLLLLGLFTRAAAALLTIEMGVAIWKVHSVHGIYAVRDYEFPLTLAAACFVLATVGAGLVSADHAIFEGGGGGRGGGKPRAHRGGRD